MFNLMSKSKGLNRNLAKHQLSLSIFKLARSTITSKADDYQYLQNSDLPTMHFQSCLPRLPIPTLEETCRRYMSAQSPLLSLEQYEKTSSYVKHFLLEDGPELQNELVAIDSKNRHTSYISGPWFDMYLKDRKPLPINYNPFLIIVPEPDPKYNTQLVKATNLIISSLRFMKSLNADLLKPDIYSLNPKKSDSKFFCTVTKYSPTYLRWYVAFLLQAFPLDMSQYQNLFNSTRIPELGKDRIFRSDSSKHVVVMRRGHFYTFDVLDEDENIYEPTRIASCLKSIVEDNRPPNEHPVGVLTASERDHWADIRFHLINIGNMNVLKKIDSAIFCMILDDEDIGDDYNTLIRTYLHSDATNRWFDKSFSFIVSKNGYAGINFEHSWGDGVAVLRFLQDVEQDISKQPKFHPDDVDDLVEMTSAIETLQFSLDEKVKDAINMERKKYQEWTNQLVVDYMIYEGFGKDKCKQLKLSPDGIMQLAFQLALYYQEERMVPTYESCSTAACKHGRTEAIRSCTKDTKAFCIAINQKQTETSQLRKIIDNCMTTHRMLTTEAAFGKGFDRHLFALKLISQRLSRKPAIFEDPAYEALNCNVLSTSTLGSTSILLGGFGPVIKDGYGIGYMMQRKRLGAVVTSYQGSRDASEYVESLKRAITSIQEIVEST